MGFAPSFRLDGQIGLISGAGRGIGRHVALAVAEQGADVALVARSDDQLATVAADVEALGRRALPIALDVTAIDGIEPALAHIARELGPLDFLVNSAGTNVQRPALEVEHTDWDRVLDINLRSAFFWSQAVARSLIARKATGRIVHIASQIAQVGFDKRAAYAASKSGLVGMARVLALEWAKHGIRVNCVGPTFVDTPLARTMLKDAEIAAEVMRRIPIGRLGRTEEVAGAVLYLLSASGDLVTGHHLVVDGGWTAQ